MGLGLWQRMIKTIQVVKIIWVSVSSGRWRVATKDN
jgi:hypothetical protein